MSTPIMPKATAVWLIDNTALTFEQIANFCGLHKIEVQAMADEQFSMGLQPADPIDNGQLTMEEISRCENDPSRALKINDTNAVNVKSKKQRKYTPISKRRDKPGSVLWIIKHYPKITDAKICTLLSTTKKIVQSIRDRTYPNILELIPKDPVFLGFCTQIELNSAIKETEHEVGS